MFNLRAAPGKRVHTAAIGQALPEYGLILALGICVCIAALNFLDTNLDQKITCLAKGIAVGAKNNVNC